MSNPILPEDRKARADRYGALPRGTTETVRLSDGLLYTAEWIGGAVVLAGASGEVFWPRFNCDRVEDAVAQEEAGQGTWRG